MTEPYSCTFQPSKVYPTYLAYMRKLAERVAFSVQGTTEVIHNEMDEYGARAEEKGMTITTHTSSVYLNTGIREVRVFYVRTKAREDEEKGIPKELELRTETNYFTRESLDTILQNLAE